MSGLNHSLLRAIESKIGNVQRLQSMPVDEHRREVEEELQHPLTIHRRFPFIGRGNVNGDRVLSRKEIEAELDKVLK